MPNRETTTQDVPPTTEVSIQQTRSQRFASLRESEVSLPEGVSITDWTIEKVRWQNPRIRALLGCIRLLGGVLESNYAILHCSPERLLEIWRKVRQVADLIRTEVGPLLKSPSRFPELEEARQRTELALTMLLGTVIKDLDRFPSRVPTNQLIEVRKLLCVSIGQLHSFLQDTFGEIMANDPRSSHDADYFLSKRFPQDLEEAEWLHSTVRRLDGYLRKLDQRRIRDLSPLIAEVHSEQSLPIASRWEKPASFLDLLLDSLTPKLKEVLALRGIRFYEMEILDRYAVEIPTQCRMLQEIYQTGRTAAEEVKQTIGKSRVEREQGVRNLIQCHAVFSQRLGRLMTTVDKELRDLVAFVPIWLDSIENRRALLLKRSVEAQAADGEASLDDLDDPKRDTQEIPGGET